MCRKGFKESLSRAVGALAIYELRNVQIFVSVSAKWNLKGAPRLVEQVDGEKLNFNWGSRACAVKISSEPICNLKYTGSRKPAQKPSCKLTRYLLSFPFFASARPLQFKPAFLWYTGRNVNWFHAITIDIQFCHEKRLVSRLN